MPLTMRPAGLGSGIDKDRPDYTLLSGGWVIGRIYQTRGGPDSLRWFWSMNANGPMTRADRVATLEKAKAQFQKSWEQWKEWAKLRERMTRLEHRGAVAFAFVAAAAVVALLRAVWEWL
jgi:hypothetical protein